MSDTMENNKEKIKEYNSGVYHLSKKRVVTEYDEENNEYYTDYSCSFFEEKINKLLKNNISPEKIMIDP